MRVLVLAPKVWIMNLNSRLFDRIRVKSKPQEPEPAPQNVCNHPGCQNFGEFRAPMGRLREGQYFLFCLEHVREYNQTYNYFNGMSDDAVAKYQKEAMLGHRPTWAMGAKKNAADPGPDGNGFADPLGIFGRKTGPKAPEARQPRYGVVAIKSLSILGLDETATAETIKTRYKELVKRHHPDANGGDRSTEDKLREIIQAYKQLKSSGLG